MLFLRLWFWVCVISITESASTKRRHETTPPTKPPATFYEDEAPRRHNATLHRRNGFNKWGGCDKVYKKPDGVTVIGKGKDILWDSWSDMLRITQYVHPFLSYDSDGHLIPLVPGPIEKRFYGEIVRDSDKFNVIYNVFSGAANWYPWYPFDWFWGSRIELYCEQDQPNPKGLSCADPSGGGPGKVRAYALNIDGKAKIIFCAPYFTLLPSLADKKKELDQPGYESARKDLNWMNVRAKTFFHEMTHLKIVGGTTRILDQIRAPGHGGEKVYGPRLCERLAREWPDFAHLNADNHACGCKWFSQFYGEPNPTTSAVISGEDENSSWESFYSDGSTTQPGDIEPPNYDEISAHERMAFLARDFTPNGWLKNRKLRILPLGDSITAGFPSTDGNGYRKHLVTILQSAGNTVQMIGSQRYGNMENPEHEGWPTQVISQIATHTSAYAQRPNVVLLHVGTNDINQDLGLATAAQRVDSLVQQLLNACPDATIIVARIVPNAFKNVGQFNNQLSSLMDVRAMNGQHVMLVDMPSGVTVDDLGDGLHPSDVGYRNMAYTWAISLTAADYRGWIKDPVPGAVAPTPINPCNTIPYWLPQGEIASGTMQGGNIFLTASCVGNSVTKLCDCTTGKDVPLEEAAQYGAKCFAEELKYTIVRAIHFADLNGDGRAEYIRVSADSSIDVWLNLGGLGGDLEAASRWWPQGKVGSGVGGKRGEIRFGDIDGDGKADYLWIHPDSSVDAWLNMGSMRDGYDAARVGWLPQGKIADGILKDGAGVRFADINGDGRADYLWISPEGAVHAWLNMGRNPNSNKIGWLPQGIIASGGGIGITRDNIILADINGDRRADYLVVSRTNGRVDMWLNGGDPNEASQGEWIWWPKGMIASGVGTSGLGADFADLTGDGKAEYLDVHNYTSAVHAWLNRC